MTATSTPQAAAHQFARSKVNGIKFLFPFGNPAARLPVSDLPAHPDLSAVPVQCETCSSIQPAQQMHRHPAGLQCHTCKHGTTGDMVRRVAGSAADFEFYPTTSEIITALIEDLRAFTEEHGRYREITTALDIGAGSGKVLCALRDAPGLDIGTLYAIEKSLPLIQAMPPDVRIVGTDFHQQSLLTKAVDVTFSNPPYSEFEAWAVRIIRESTSRAIYLVIPQRWQQSHAIAAALEYSNRAAVVVGSFDFENAEDREARARVHLLRVAMPEVPDFEEIPDEPADERRARLRAWQQRRQFRRDFNNSERPDTFRLQFNEQFADLLRSFEETSKNETAAGQGRAPSAAKFASLVPGEGYAASLVAMYQADLAHVERNYAAAAQLDADLLREFDINPAKICDCLRDRLAGLRNAYWHELFSRLDKITARLTQKTRRGLLDQLHAHVHVDFTLSNIEAVVIWVLKNANQCLDAQLVEVFERMVSKANVIAYKSNQRTFEQDGWRYNAARDKWSHFALDYRIVCEHIGGITGASWRGTNNLSDEAHTFLEDLRTIAHNLGFQRIEGHSDTRARRWIAGASEPFHCMTPKGCQQLFSVRAFGNGNLHLKLNQKFILALNVEHGRLKGWIKNPAQAAEEMKDPAAGAFFRSNLALPVPANPLQLLA